MATTIKLKNGSGAPLAGDLVQGEPALDLTNKRLYTEDSGGTVIEVGTNPSTIDINAGTIDGTVIGGSSAAAGTFTTFTSTGIDDNATSTAITIDSSQNVSLSGDLTVDTNTLYVDSTNNRVGIGTSSPSRLLHLNSAAPEVWVVNSTDGSRTSLLYDSAEFTVSVDAGVGAASSAFVIDVDNSERMRIDSSGNVGIGVSGPTNTLSVLGTGATTYASSKGVVVDYSTSSTSNVLPIGFGWSSSIGNQNPYWGMGFIPTNYSAGLADLGFYTGGTERMRIDASGNVGIGTLSPTGNLEVVGGSSSNVTIRGTSGSGADTDVILDLTARGSGGQFRNTEIRSIGANTSGGILTFSTDNTSAALTERMRIDSSGNVGIDFTPKTMTANVTSSLNVGSGTVFQRTKDTYLGSNMYYDASDVGKSISTGYGLVYVQDVTNGAHKWLTSAVSAGSADATHAFSTPMTIDSSGNLLVGTTNANPTSSGVNDPGVELSNTGGVRSTVASNPAATFNRKTDDGDIAIFRKDGTTVGNIGSEGGNSLTIGNGDTGLLFSGANDAIHAWNTSTNASRDGAIDLGRSSQRFKDLYLSGGAYLGGTGAANQLDDYEEGTWTPVFNTGYSSLTYVARTGVYTKIGNMVELKFFLQVTGTTASGNLTITGLPFSSGANSINNNVGIIHVQTNSGTLTTDSPICRLGASSTTIHVQTQGTTSINSMAGSELGNGIINGSITYFTS